MLDEAWNWFFRYDLNEAGGASFVEIATGINLAVAGWEQFQDKLNLLRIRCEGIINATTCHIEDKRHKNRLCGIFARVSKPIIVLHKCSWCTTFIGALVCSVAGFYMTYTNRYCRHDWLLLTPTAVHLAITLTTLSTFSLFAKILTYCCDITNASDITNEIRQLDTDTREHAVSEAIEEKSVAANPAIDSKKLSQPLETPLSKLPKKNGTKKRNGSNGNSSRNQG